MSSFKICPRCRKETVANATCCRHCAYRFGAAPPATARVESQSAPPPTARMVLWDGILAAIAALTGR
jgi:hypothetical protein